MKGRPRKPLNKHKAEGTYRAHMRDRVGAESAIQSGDMEMPSDLTAAGRKLWRDYVRWFPAVLLKPSDSLVLADLCRLHPAWVRLIKSRKSGAIEKALKVWTKVNACYSKLGLSPVDRARIEMPQKPADESNPLEQLRLIGAPKEA